MAYKEKRPKGKVNFSGDKTIVDFAPGRGAGKNRAESGGRAKTGQGKKVRERGKTGAV